MNWVEERRKTHVAHAGERSIVQRVVGTENTRDVGENALLLALGNHEGGVLDEHGEELRNAQSKLRRRGFAAELGVRGVFWELPCHSKYRRWWKP